MIWTEEQTDAIALVGDHNWRSGPKWRAALAWAFGHREVIHTHLGDILIVRWWRGAPFLTRILSRRKDLT